jgi:hypothetical protein
MGTSRRIYLQQLGQNEIADELRSLAFGEAKKALDAKITNGFLSAKEIEKYEKIRNNGANIAAVKIGDYKYVACSSVCVDDYIYNEYFVTREPDENEVIHVSLNKEINVTGRGWLKKNDSEVKLLREIVYNHEELLSSEIIHVYTYREPCLSCDYYIINFLKKYENATIHIYYERNYPDGEIDPNVIETFTF